MLVTFKGAGESWKEARENFIKDVNLFNSYGVYFVGLSQDESGCYLVAYEDNGVLSFSPLRLSTRGLSMPFKPCMKYIETPTPINITISAKYFSSIELQQL